MDQTVIYTDGSCYPNPGPGGWAFVVYEGGLEVHACTGSESQTTNNRMEMRAVLEALKWLQGRPARVLSDSQYVVKGIVAWSPSWKRRGWMRKDGNRLIEVANADLWRNIDEVRSPAQRFTWVRGHVGTRGNERADQLAEHARARSDERSLHGLHSAIQAV